MICYLCKSSSLSSLSNALAGYSSDGDGVNAGSCDSPGRHYCRNRFDKSYISLFFVLSSSLCTVSRSLYAEDGKSTVSDLIGEVSG